MEKICEFKSVRLKMKEIPMGEKGAMILRKDYDIAGAMDHRLVLGPRMILSHRAWIANLVPVVMAAALFFALLYGLMTAVMGVDFSSAGGRAAVIALIASLSVLSLASWAILSFMGAVKGLKRAHVVEMRGSGNWILVDSAEWDRFHRIMTAPKEDEEKAE